MTVFSLGALRDWEVIATGELIGFDVPINGYRRVQFDLMADSFVSVLAVAGDRSWLVGCGEGRVDVEFSTNEAVAITVFGPEKATVMMRTKVATQQVAESAEPTFTTIEPRVAGPAEEVKRLMHIMRINAQLREDTLRAEVDAKLAEYRHSAGEAASEAAAEGVVE